MSGKIGSYNLALPYNSANRVAFSIPVVDAVYVYVLVKFEYTDDLDAENDLVIMRFRNAADSNSMGRLRMDSDGSFDVYDEVGSSTTAGSVHAEDTPIWLKVRCKDGTGADSEIGLNYWTGSAWSGWTEATSGNQTFDIGVVRVENQQDEAAETNYWDNMIIKRSATDPFTGDPTTY
jgi:hypothetical protein